MIAVAEPKPTDRLELAGARITAVDGVIQELQGNRQRLEVEQAGLEARLAECTAELDTIRLAAAFDPSHRAELPEARVAMARLEAEIDEIGVSLVVVDSHIDSARSDRRDAENDRRSAELASLVQTERAQHAACIAALDVAEARWAELAPTRDQVMLLHGYPSDANELKLFGMSIIALLRPGWHRQAS